METGDSWRSAAGVHGVVQGGSWKLRGGGSITVNDAGVEVPRGGKATCLSGKASSACISWDTVLAARIHSTKGGNVLRLHLAEARPVRLYPERRLYRRSDYALVTESQTSALYKAIMSGLPTPRRYLCVVNPASGKGRGPQIFEFLREILEAAGHNLVLCATQKPGDASAVVRTLDSSSVDGVVCVGGDGIVHEVIQGLYGREDGMDVLRYLPLCHVPAGSGNGLAASLGAVNVDTALWSLCYGGVGQMDCAEVSQPGHGRSLSHLCCAWGLISDLDINTEWMRWVGDLRFHLGAMHRIMAKRLYTGRLSYLPAIGTDVPSIDELTTFGPSWVSVEGQFGLLAAATAPRIGADFWMHGRAGVDGRIAAAQNATPGGVIDLLYTTAELTRWQLLRGLLKADSQDFCDLPYVQYRKVWALVLEPNAGEKGQTLTIDGEELPLAPLSVIIKPSALRDSSFHFTCVVPWSTPCLLPYVTAVKELGFFVDVAQLPFIGTGTELAVVAQH